MNDVWLRWAGLFIPQVVILAGLYFNRRPVADLTEKVDRVEEMMVRHLESHVAQGKRR